MFAMLPRKIDDDLFKPAAPAPMAPMAAAQAPAAPMARTGGGDPAAMGELFSAYSDKVPDNDDDVSWWDMEEMFRREVARREKAERDEKERVEREKVEKLETSAREDPAFKSDPELARARVRARGELGEKLKVLDPGDTSKKPNEISDKEMAELVEIHARIDLGRSDLMIAANQKPNGDAEKDAMYAAGFKKDALRDITTMMQTESGRELIKQLDNNETQGKLGKVHHKTVLSDKTIEGQNVYGDDPAAKGNILAADLEKLGVKGADKRTGHSIISLAAGRNINHATSDKWFEEVRSDVALFHEMVHSLHFTHGTVAKGEVTKAESARDKDIGLEQMEYQAAGLGKFAKDKLTENTYRKERKLLAGAKGEIMNKNSELADATMSQRPWYVAS